MVYDGSVEYVRVVLLHETPSALAGAFCVDTGSYIRSSGKRLSSFAWGRGADGKGRVDEVARSFSRKFYNSVAWERCREAFRLSKFGLCERCGMPGEEVHHKTWLTPDNINDPYVTLSWDNLELLCMSCHSKEHMSKYSAFEDGYSIGADGDLVYTPPFGK